MQTAYTAPITLLCCTAVVLDDRIAQEIQEIFLRFSVTAVINANIKFKFQKAGQTPFAYSGVVRTTNLFCSIFIPKTTNEIQFKLDVFCRRQDKTKQLPGDFFHSQYRALIIVTPALQPISNGIRRILPIRIIEPAYHAITNTQCQTKLFDCKLLLFKLLVLFMQVSETCMNNMRKLCQNCFKPRGYSKL